MITDPITLAFLIIMAIAATLALILAYNATKKKATAASLQELSSNAIRDAIEQELKKALPQEVEQVGSIAASLSQYVNQEVERQLLVKSEEITERYEHAIDEKNKSIDFVEKQFHSVSERYQKLNHEFKSLGKEKKQTEEIVRSMAEGVIMVDQKGEILLMNPAAEKLLGVQKGEKIGKSILADLKDEQLVSLAQEISGKEEKEIILQSKNDQTKKVLKASNAIIENADGKTVGFVSILSDVTKQKELDDLKDAFVANISHDLRTPLNSVQESLTLLRDHIVGPLTADQERIITIGINNLKRLSRFINDLLDLSKLEAKKFPIKVSLFRLDDLIKAIMEEFEALRKSKNVDVETIIPEPVELEADQDRISQVLANLFGNAIKFTPKGGKITLEARNKNHQGASANEAIVVSVRDTGPGITKRDHQKIFEKFVQLESIKLQGVSGTGLGLAIAKEIVELHGGRIWVESEEGKGSCFVFEIPKRTAVINKD